MYVQVGTYQHPVNEVNLRRMEIRHKLSPRNKRMTKIITLYLEGELQYSTQATLTAAIRELIDAYNDDYQSVGLYQDDGTPTPHVIDNVGSISGVKILGRNWPMGDGAEYATKRTFSITAQAEYLDVETQLVSWKESVRVVGSGGPDFEIEDTYQGPKLSAFYPATHVRIIQTGEAIGFSAYVEPPGPYFPLEHGRQRQIETIGGDQQGLMACFYGTRWTYVMSSPNSVAAFPTTR